MAVKPLYLMGKKMSIPAFRLSHFNFGKAVFNSLIRVPPALDVLFLWVTERYSIVERNFQGTTLRQGYQNYICH